MATTMQAQGQAPASIPPNSTSLNSTSLNPNGNDNGNENGEGQEQGGATPAERFELITRRLQETLGGDAIRAILEQGRHPRCYWGACVL